MLNTARERKTEETDVLEHGNYLKETWKSNGAEAQT